MKFSAKSFILISLMFLLVLMSACAPVQDVTTEPDVVGNGNYPIEIQQPDDDVVNEAMDSSLEFVDATGKQVRLSGLPQRIIVAGRATPYVLDTIYLFPDAAKKLAAIEVRGFDTQAFLAMVDPEVEVKNVIERDAGPEQIAPYLPDLVIVKNISLAQLGSALEEISIPVMGMNLETPEYFYEDIRVLGTVFDNASRAEEIIAYYQNIEGQIAAMMSDVQENGRPTALVVQYSEDSGEISFKVPPASYLQTTMIRKAGGTPVWLDSDGGAEGWIQIGLEQIAVWNPEMIFVVNYNGDSVESAQKLAQSPTWEGLQAVENGQIFGFPADFASWDLIDPRWILGQQWLATLIHPERTSEIDLQAQVISFYQEMYRLTETQILDSVFPRLDEIK